MLWSGSVDKPCFDHPTYAKLTHYLRYSSNPLSIVLDAVLMAVAEPTTIATISASSTIHLE
ncbi:MAG: hypothetical protein RLP44_23090 [Aggregatilineales bacterium]